MERRAWIASTYPLTRCLVGLCCVAWPYIGMAQSLSDDITTISGSGDRKSVV